MTGTPHDGSFAEMIDAARIIVCCGTGGVGKTTTSAALGLHAARTGRRAVVVTIDPAKRLADALGLGDLPNEPARIDIRTGNDGAGNDGTAGGGELWAMMLDTRSTFDALVRRHSSDPSQAERILANRFYRNISGALSGTQEYMAAEKLFELHDDDRFDLVIVDTPPTRNALDFLEAPDRLVRFLDHRLYRILLAPARSGVRVLNAAAQPLLRTIGRVVGTETLSDAIGFFEAFDGMESGFRDRAAHVVGLLRSTATRWVLVASPRHDTVEEALWFAEALGEQAVRVDAVILNRVLPRFGRGSDAATREQAEIAREQGDAALGNLLEMLADLRTAAEDESTEIDRIVAATPDADFVTVELLEHDVCDLTGLDEIATRLFSRP
jgi:anion-transporting  ArsA/GET3 family ATPase